MPSSRCGRRPARPPILVACFFACALVVSPARGNEAVPFVVAAGPQPAAAPAPPADAKAAPPPEELMRRRFPQAVKVAHLIGLPMLDWNDSTIGHISHVARTPDGKIALVVPYSAWFGWASFAPGKRPVAVPIEKVAILGRQVGALEMTRDDFAAAPTWSSAAAVPIPHDETITIALTRR